MKNSGEEGREGGEEINSQQSCSEGLSRICGSKHTRERLWKPDVEGQSQGGGRERGWYLFIITLDFVR